ncbi:hypothetical protein V8B97DRAFT_469173 [Scleroderma yunnanense]
MSTLALPLLCSALLISELHRCFRLWHPEPDRRYPPEYRNGGLQIGDVGFVNSNGRFMVTFNICRPADHALRSTKGVPKVFQQISVSHDDITGEADDIGSCLITPSSLIDKRGIVERSTTASRERVFAVELTSSKNGAFLYLPDGSRSKDVRTRRFSSIKQIVQAELDMNSCCRSTRRPSDFRKSPKTKPLLSVV